MWRNNNPGNIRYNPKFKGVIGKDARGFSIFKNHLYGIRAMRVLIQNYIRKRGINTIAGIVNRYAPAADNNKPLLYAKYVSQQTGIPMNQRILLSQVDMIIPAMVRMETGKSLAPNDIKDSYNPEGKMTWIPPALLAAFLYLLSKIKA